MQPGHYQERRRSRPGAERLEGRLALSAGATVPAEVRAILRGASNGVLVRPNTPVAPLEAPASSATFVDPSAQVLQGGRVAVGRRDYIAPFVLLDARGGFIRVGSNSTVQDNASLVANPSRARGTTGIAIGDNVVVAAGARIVGPASIGGAGGANTAIGANAVVDGAIVQAGAYVGPLARVGPGVTIGAGFRVLPGANVTNQAQATDPALGQVAYVAATDAVVATTATAVGRIPTLAAGYTNLYQGQSAAGPGTSGSGGPLPAALNGTTTFFGALNNVLGASREPGSALVAFQPAAAVGTPTFRQPDGTDANLPPNVAYRFPARVIGQVAFGQDAASARRALGRRDSIRGDEGQAIRFSGPLARVGNGVTFHSPNGGVRSTTTTTVTTATTVVGTTTSTTNATTVTTNAAATATPGTTTATTTGTDADGRPTAGTVTTTIATSTFQVGGISVGANFAAGDGAVILGGPGLVATFGDGVSVGAGAVVAASNLGLGVAVGARAYVQDSTIAAGTVIPPGAIVINDRVVGTVQN